MKGSANRELNLFVCSPNVAVMHFFGEVATKAIFIEFIMSSLVVAYIL